MPSLTSSKYRFAFIMITSLFFFWGFVHNINSTLIPHLKRSFTLNVTQSTLIDSSIYIAYFLMALPAGFIMKKFGYKAGIIAGLFFFATGIFLFIPAANIQSYGFFLVALFIIACGLAMLETAANPYASMLGDPETSTQRLNFSQSFNGLAAVLAPVIGARVILTQTYSDIELNSMTEAARKVALASEASSVKTPYFIFGILLLLVLVVFVFTKLPVIQSDDDQAGGKNIFHAFRHRHLTWAVVAQFFYVGGQVCILSLFVLYASKSAGISEIKASDYAGICGGAFLAGRFLGTFLMKYIKPERLLALNAAINILLCVVAIEAHGMITVYAVIAICFFMSIMFPTIFALGIKELKGDTEFGSSLLIMSIVGGAILPRIFGYISDSTGDIQNGYIVPLVCFAVILFFGLKGYKVVAKATA
jgi:FHS family L-fucose permease-like MFS transporter